jgi:hypothetical protein
MKKYLFLLAISLTFSIGQAQEISDALLYSQDNLTGNSQIQSNGWSFWCSSVIYRLLMLTLQVLPFFESIRVSQVVLHLKQF